MQQGKFQSEYFRNGFKAHSGSIGFSVYRESCYVRSRDVCQIQQAEVYIGFSFPAIYYEGLEPSAFDSPNKSLGIRYGSSAGIDQDRPFVCTAA